MDTKESRTHAALLRECKTFLAATDFTANVTENQNAAELIRKIDKALGEENGSQRQPAQRDR